MTSIQQALKEIQETQSFDRLEFYKDSKIWSGMTQAERDLFAFLLIRHGAQQLATGEGKILENFTLAAEVVDHSASIFYQQGLVFAAYPDNNRCLSLASQSYARAIEKDPDFFMAWYEWANVCVAQGVLNSDFQHFIEANQKFEKSFQLFSAVSTLEIGKDVLHWKWGSCLSFLGKHAGEPVDFYQAIAHYRLAADLGCQEAQFLSDYGHALTDLGTLVEKTELVLEASKLFYEAVQLDGESPGRWADYACCMQRICEMIPNEDYFNQAHKSFEKAIELDADNGQLWLMWAQLEVNYGKFKRNQKYLESSLEKFAKADELEKGHPTILRCWAKAELYLGSHLERLDLIQMSKLRIMKSLELQSDNPDAWYTYGACLNELGHYFEEVDYYYQALEKFHYGLSLAPQYTLLWYGLALTHFALGEMTEEVAMYEKSIQYCAKVLECNDEAFPQFWNDWGVALLKLGEITEQTNYIEWAIEKFEYAFKRPLHSDYEDVDLEWVYNYGCALDLLGELTEESRHIEKAIQVLSQVVQLDSDYMHARYNLALALAHFGEMASDVESYYKSIEHFQILLESDPEDELIHMDFGVSLVNLALLVKEEHQPERSQNFFKQAEQQLMQAASLGNCQAYYQLAGMYSLTGYHELAMHYMERAQFFKALPTLDDLMHDEWLDNLRETPAFRQFISQLSSQQSKDDK